MKAQAGSWAGPILTVVGLALFGASNAHAATPRATVGVYYFDGWAGQHARADTEAWAKDAPTHLSKRMLDEFPDREPIWGWRDDKPEVMEQQIDLAADHGLAFFAFCWYWHPTPEQIRDDPKHTGLNLFLKAENSNRMKFCLLVANHEGFLLGSAENWTRAAEGWMPYFKDKRYVTVDGKPLVIIFNPADGSSEGLAALQAAVKQAGLPGVAVAGCGRGDLKQGYTHRTYYNIVPGYADGAQQHSYAELVAAHQKAWSGSAQQPFIPEITAGWDKRPWEGPQGLGQKPGYYFPDRTPAAFGQFVQSAARLDGPAPRADDEGAAGPRICLERVRRRRLHRANQRRSAGPILEGAPVRRSAGGVHHPRGRRGLTLVLIEESRMSDCVYRFTGFQQNILRPHRDCGCPSSGVSLRRERRFRCPWFSLRGACNAPNAP